MLQADEMLRAERIGGASGLQPLVGAPALDHLFMAKPGAACLQQVLQGRLSALAPAAASAILWPHTVVLCRVCRAESNVSKGQHAQRVEIDLSADSAAIDLSQNPAALVICAILTFRTTVITHVKRPSIIGNF